MQDFLKFLISPLLSEPDQLVIEPQPAAVYVSAAPADTGRVIGKHGAIITAIRILLRVYCTLNHLSHSNLIFKTDSDSSPRYPGSVQGPSL